MLVAALQTYIGQSYQKNLASAKKLILKATKQGAVICCLPEYFSFPRQEVLSPELVESVRNETLTFLEEMSLETRSVLVGGSVLEITNRGYKNVCYVFDSGQRLARIEKQMVTAGEKVLGVVSGSQKDLFNINGIPATVRICADILFPETCLGLRGKVRLLFVPLISPVRQVDPTRERRDCLFIVRAFDTNSFIVKTGAVGLAPLSGNQIAGRSLIAAPNGILARASKEDQEIMLLQDLDFETLADFDLVGEMFPPKTIDYQL